MGYNMFKSIRIKLDDVVKDKKDEQLIMENLRRCKYFAGKQFALILWNEKLNKKDVENFFKEHQELLFLLNTKITKEFGHTWFLINTDNINGDESRYRYKWNGSILTGLVQYNKMINYMNEKERDEDSNRR